MTDNRRSPALDELRAQLHEAARRQLEPTPQPRGHWSPRRQLAVAVAAALLLAGAIAGAAQLISTGKDAKDVPGKPRRYQPGPGGSTVVATAPDPAGGGAWGLARYRSTSGEACVIVGQLRGTRLGLVSGGLFHRYQSTTSGVCGDLDRFPVIGDVRRFSTADGARSLVYGLARPGVTAVRVSQHGHTTVAQTQHGSYLLVFRGSLAASGVRVVPG